MSAKQGGTLQHGVLSPPGGNNCVVHGNGIEKEPLDKEFLPCCTTYPPTTKNMSYTVMGNGYTVAFRHKIAKVLPFFKIIFYYLSVLICFSQTLLLSFKFFC